MSLIPQWLKVNYMGLLGGQRDEAADMIIDRRVESFRQAAEREIERRSKGGLDKDKVISRTWYLAAINIHAGVTSCVFLPNFGLGVLRSDHEASILKKIEPIVKKLNDAGVKGIVGKTDGYEEHGSLWVQFHPPTSKAYQNFEVHKSLSPVRNLQ